MVLKDGAALDSGPSGGDWRVSIVEQPRPGPGGIGLVVTGLGMNCVGMLVTQEGQFGDVTLPGVWRA